MGDNELSAVTSPTSLENHQRSISKEEEPKPASQLAHAPSSRRSFSFSQSIFGGSRSTNSSSSTQHLSRSSFAAAYQTSLVHAGSSKSSDSSFEQAIPENASFSGDEGEILYSGFLTKRGHVVTNWKTRFFVLRPGGRLSYYANESMGKKVGEVYLSKVSPWSGETNGFMFYTTKQIAYYVYAGSNAERGRWIDALSDYYVQPDPVDCEGYLTKRGHMVPSHRLRYFVLQGRTIKYFADETAYRSGMSALTEMEVKSGGRWDAMGEGLFFKTATGATLFVVAENVAERQKWLEALSKIVSGPMPITCAGWLTKKGHKRKSWKRRYFILRGAYMSYYSDFDTANARGSQPLGEVGIREVVPWDGELYGFMFVTLDGVPYYVFADNERDQIKWLSALRKLVTTQNEKNNGNQIVDEEDTEKRCPRCNCVLTGTRFCGACGFNLRGNAQSSLPQSQTATSMQEFTATNEAVTSDHMEGEGGVHEDENSALDDLDALSEGARTLLLAVMQNPDVQTAISGPSNTPLELLGPPASNVLEDDQPAAVSRLKQSDDMTRGIDLDSQVTNNRTPTNTPMQKDHDQLQKQQHREQKSPEEGAASSQLHPPKLKIVSDDAQQPFHNSEGSGSFTSFSTDQKEQVQQLPPPPPLIQQLPPPKSNSKRNIVSSSSGSFFGPSHTKSVAALLQEVDSDDDDNDGDIKDFCSGADQRQQVQHPPATPGTKSNSKLSIDSSSSDSVGLTRSNSVTALKEVFEKGLKKDHVSSPDQQLVQASPSPMPAVIQTNRSNTTSSSSSSSNPKLKSDMQPPLLHPLSSRLLGPSNSESVDALLREIDKGEEEKESKHGRAIGNELSQHQTKPQKFELQGSSRQFDTLPPNDDHIDADEAQLDAVESHDVLGSSPPFPRISDPLVLDGITGLELDDLSKQQKQHTNDKNSRKKNNDACIYAYMEKELQFMPLFVPYPEAPVRCRLYASMAYNTSRKICLFLTDSGPLGLWKQPQEDMISSSSTSLSNMIDKSHPFTLLPFLHRAQQEGFSLVVCNPFSNSAKVFEETGHERVVPIPSSSTPKEHVLFVWQKFLEPTTAEVSVVALQRGGALAVSLLLEKPDARTKIARIAFVDSKHVVERDMSVVAPVLEFLGRKTIQWEASLEQPLGGQIVESQERVGCVCLSMGRVDAEPNLLRVAEEPVFAFLTANPSRPGMTAIVKHVRSVLRQLHKRKEDDKRNYHFPPSRASSNVFVLGESHHGGHSDEIGVDDDHHAAVPNYYLPKSISSNAAKSASHKAGHTLMTMRDFELLQVVGQGGFGKVFLAKKVSEPHKGEQYAMKVLKKQHVLSSGLVNTTMAERKILTEIAHPFVVKLFYAFQSENKLYLVMDYLSGGSLAMHLRFRRKFPESWARFYGAEVAAAIAHLHHVNIIYRDAKLENVLMDHEGHVRITDFGLSKQGVSGLQGATTFCGTAAYIAPELLKGQTYGKAADWWSFGILLYEMIGGKPPYYHRNRDIMFQTILKQEWVTFTPEFSDTAVSLIRGLLTRDPTRRLGSGPRGADEVLTHPFFDSIDYAALLAKRIPPPFSPGVGKFDTTYVAHNLNEVTAQDRQASLMQHNGVGPQQFNDFDGFSFVGRSSRNLLDS